MMKVSRRRQWLITALWVGLPAFCSSGAQAAGSIEVAVIVSAENDWAQDKSAFSRSKLARIYRRQVRLSSDGIRLHPINLSAGHPLREGVSKALFKRTPHEMASFWNERYFQGVSPPHVVHSQEAMIRFVARTAGAIGYVARCAVDERVKVVSTFYIKGELARDELCP